MGYWFHLVVDKLLLYHDGLPHVLNHAVHLEVFLALWVGIFKRHSYY